MISVIYSRCREATGTQDQLVTRRLAAPIGEPGDVVTEITIGVTGAAGFPFPAEGAAEFLTRKPLSPENVDVAAQIASENIEYLSDQYAPAEYRRQLVKTEIGRALLGLKDWPSS
jgi:CO/xanthine dehydrogenase FAD-binding subunit